MRRLGIMAQLHKIYYRKKTPKSVPGVVYNNFFGGVISIPRNIFRKINGFTNELQGWGFEDQDILIRLKKGGHVTVALDQVFFTPCPTSMPCKHHSRILRQENDYIPITVSTLLNNAPNHLQNMFEVVSNPYPSTI